MPPGQSNQLDLGCSELIGELLKQNKRQLQPTVDQKVQHQIIEPLPQKRLQAVIWYLLCKDRFIVTQNSLEKSL